MVELPTANVLPGKNGTGDGERIEGMNEVSGNAILISAADNMGCLPGWEWGPNPMKLGFGMSP